MGFFSTVKIWTDLDPAHYAVPTNPPADDGGATKDQAYFVAPTPPQGSAVSYGLMWLVEATNPAAAATVTLDLWLHDQEGAEKTAWIKVASAVVAAHGSLVTTTVPAGAKMYAQVTAKDANSLTLRAGFRPL